MTQPRQVLSGRIICITRRCSERRFFLRPDRTTIETLEYLLAVGAAKYGMKVVAVVVMSNHVHVILFDPHGRHPEFTQWFDSLLARVTNCYRRRVDAFWAAEPVSVVELADAEAVVDMIAYLAANPVEALCVEHGRDWPGVRSNPQSYLAEPKEVRRPDFFFREQGKLPETAWLDYEVPPTHQHLDVHDFVALVAERVALSEAKHRAEAKLAGKSFLGARGVRSKTGAPRPNDANAAARTRSDPTSPPRPARSASPSSPASRSSDATTTRPVRRSSKANTKWSSLPEPGSSDQSFDAERRRRRPL